MHFPLLSKLWTFVRLQDDTRPGRINCKGQVLITNKILHRHGTTSMWTPTFYTHNQEITYQQQQTVNTRWRLQQCSKKCLQHCTLHKFLTVTKWRPYGHAHYDTGVWNKNYFLVWKSYRLSNSIWLTCFKLYLRRRIEAWYPTLRIDLVTMSSAWPLMDRNIRNYVTGSRQVQRTMLKFYWIKRMSPLLA